MPFQKTSSLPTPQETGYGVPATVDAPGIWIGPCQPPE